jgi:hypothetical protein
VQEPTNSQNFNRYSYCLNNPLRYTDPSGEWFGLDDLLVAGCGFVSGYVTNGLNTGNWGWESVKKGLGAAVSSWIVFNTVSLANMNGLTTNTTWNAIINSSANTVVNTFMPSISVPLSENIGITFSPAFGFGPGGFTSGINFGAYYTNGDLSIDMTYGISDTFSGYYGYATIDGWGLGYGKSFYSSSYCVGANADSQITATWGAYFHGDVSFRISNDLWGDGKDRWRTTSAELSVDNYSVGTYVVTNYGETEGGGRDQNRKAPWPVGRNLNRGYGAWNDGKVYSAPLWVGFKSNNRVLRYGLSYPVVQNLTQNLVHRGFGKAPFYLNYDDMKRGLYSYYGYDNPISMLNF